MNIDFQKLVTQKYVIDSSTHEKSKKLSVRMVSTVIFYLALAFQ